MQSSAVSAMTLENLNAVTTIQMGSGGEGSHPNNANTNSSRVTRGHRVARCKRLHLHSICCTCNLYIAPLLILSDAGTHPKRMPNRKHSGTINRLIVRSVVLKIEVGNASKKWELMHEWRIRQEYCWNLSSFVLGFKNLLCARIQ